MGSLDDLIFTSGSARDAAESAQPMISILSELGWLIHPTNCVGTSEAAQTFTALRSLADLPDQTYAVPPATIDSILSGFTAPLKPESGWWPC
jgi:hypothetical protein